MTDAVIVREPQTVVRVSDVAVRVIAATPGPPGPPGPPGEAYYRHDQTAPDSEWVVNHNLGARPVVAVFSTGGAAMLAHVIHTSDHQARVYFDAPVAGYAICT